MNNKYQHLLDDGHYDHLIQMSDGNEYSHQTLFLHLRFQSSYSDKK